MITIKMRQKMKRAFKRKPNSISSRSLRLILLLFCIFSFSLLSALFQHIMILEEDDNNNNNSHYRIDMDKETYDSEIIIPLKQQEGILNSKKMVKYMRFNQLKFYNNNNHNNNNNNNENGPLLESQWLRKSSRIMDTSLLSLVNDDDHDIHQNNDNEQRKYYTIPKILNKVYIEKGGDFQSYNDMTNIGSGTLIEAHESWSRHNPEYEIRYFNLNLCRQYLKEHFHPIFLRAFDCIQAFSGKVNLFRMLVVYAEGGWYSDWKQTSMRDNVLDHLSQDVDFYGLWDYGANSTIEQKCMQNCFFGAIPRHPLLAKMIKNILVNVQTEHYGLNPLFTTGTCLFGNVYRAYVAEQNPHEERIRLGYFQAGFIKNKLDEIDGRNNNIQQEVYAQHKCEGCGMNQTWNSGNNYNLLFENHGYYCQDAKSLFRTAV